MLNMFKDEEYKKIYELLVEASSDGMLSVNTEGIITFLNPAGMKILKVKDNVIGKHITEAVDFEPTILSVLKTGQGYVDKEFRLEGKSGVAHFIKTAIPLIDDTGAMVGVLDIFRNIDEVKTMVNRMSGAQAKYSIYNIMGESHEINDIRKQIKLAGSNEYPILIVGESGTGKDIIAQSIHNYSNRRNGPFIAVNCLSLPRNLIESELFGYEDGPFTRDTGARPGKFELAHGGTLFLNNLPYIPIDLQNKLIKVLQNKNVTRIGGFREIPTDVRVISSTHLNLVQMIEERNFNEELLNVLSEMTITTSPLRDRHQDIDLISFQALNQCNLVNGTDKAFSEEVKVLLRNWSWPDNVRELEDTVEHAYYAASGDTILPEHFQIKQATINVKEYERKPITLKEAEIMTIRSALEYTKGNMTKAAKILGIGRNTLYAKLKLLV